MVFIIVEGIDGSGKGFIVNTLKKHYLDSGLKVFDLRNFAKLKRCFPSDLQLQDYDIIISTEPTYCNTGKLIREKMITSKEYPPEDVAKAFAADRKELYEKIILPWKKHKVIIQERGIASSLVYQPLTSENIDIEYVKSLEGNKLALKHAPDYLLIAKVDAEKAVERLNEREKKDEAIYENLEFMKMLQKEYESAWLRELFNQHNTKVVYIDTSFALEDTKKQVLDFIETITP